MSSDPAPDLHPRVDLIAMDRERHQRHLERRARTMRGVEILKQIAAEQEAREERRRRWLWWVR